MTLLCLGTLLEIGLKNSFSTYTVLIIFNGFKIESFKEILSFGKIETSQGKKIYGMQWIGQHWHLFTYQKLIYRNVCLEKYIAKMKNPLVRAIVLSFSTNALE
jgi:hypothetical protein